MKTREWPVATPTQLDTLLREPEMDFASFGDGDIRFLTDYCDAYCGPNFKLWDRERTYLVQPMYVPFRVQFDGRATFQCVQGHVWSKPYKQEPGFAEVYDASYKGVAF